MARGREMFGHVFWGRRLVHSKGPQERVFGDVGWCTRRALKN